MLYDLEELVKETWAEIDWDNGPSCLRAGTMSFFTWMLYDYKEILLSFHTGDAVVFMKLGGKFFVCFVLWMVAFASIQACDRIKRRKWKFELSRKLEFKSRSNVFVFKGSFTNTGKALKNARLKVVKFRKSNESAFASYPEIAVLWEDGKTGNVDLVPISSPGTKEFIIGGYAGLSGAEFQVIRTEGAKAENIEPGAYNFEIHLTENGRTCLVHSVKIEIHPLSGDRSVVVIEG